MTNSDLVVLAEKAAPIERHLTRVASRVPVGPLDKLAARLDAVGIPCAVASGLALFPHGHRRFTEDVALLVTRNGLAAIHAGLAGLGWLPPYARSKDLRDTENGVEIELLVTGDFPGDGKPKPVAFPDPGAVAVEGDGIWYLSLPTLVELKLASDKNGLTVQLVEEANGMLDDARKASLPPAVTAPTSKAPEREEAVKEGSSLDELWLVKYPPIARLVSIAAAKWIFQGLSPQVGSAESIQVLDVILTRLDVIEAGKAPADVDPKVLDALSDSGLTKGERERVAGLIKAARGTGTLSDPTPIQVPAVPDAEFRATLVRLHLWWKAASAIAKTAGLKKVELIRLGLASPSKKKASAQSAPE